jgi:hypothetical protein
LGSYFETFSKKWYFYYLINSKKNLNHLLMKTKLLFFSLMIFMFSSLVLTAQEQPKVEEEKATSFGNMQYVGYVPSIAEQMRTGTFQPANDEDYEGRLRGAPAKRTHGNRVVPGKGSDINDPAKQTAAPTRQGRAPSLVFNANVNSPIGVTDPSGAVGPNHYLASWNFGFRIFDKSGNPLTPAAALSSILPGNDTGDAIMLYDPFVDRFIFTEFDNSPNGFEIAISAGPDPVNDGWHVYTNQFTTPAFPDYTKFSIWSDGYYVTANINGGGNNEGVWVVERDKMINGEPAQFVGLPLTGIATSGFYSPQGFNVTGGELPPSGDFPVVYMQDDAWGGVSNDHVKMWMVDVDWTNTANSSISAPIEFGSAQGVSTFTAVFDGGSFSNLAQPNGGISVDALQATVMNQAQYRRFCDYNSAIFNFVVDTAAGTAELAGVRWYEMRQDSDGGPWTVYQEGTYTVPGDVRHAFSASMAMDVYGNIGMAYTSVGSDAGEEISIRYTGRMADDALGDMTISEQLIAQSTANNPGERLADYVHLTVDPVDDATFWHIAEFFDPGRNDVVGVFKIAEGEPNDAAIVSIDSPIDATFTASETVIVTIRNYGNNALSSIPVSYSINGGADVNETWTGSLAPGATAQYTFTQTANLTGGGDFSVDAETNLASDSYSPNDCFGITVSTIESSDLGVVNITAPVDGTLGASEQITIVVSNFGGEEQSNFPVTYSIDGGALVTETFTGTIAIGTEQSFTFDTTADFSGTQTYSIEACTALSGDSVAENNCTTQDVMANALLLCEPTATLGCNVDGIKRFVLGDIDADDGASGCNTEPASSPQGYADRRDLSTDLDRLDGNNVYTLQAQQNWGGGVGVELFSVWIDFDDSGTFEVSERLISGETFTAAGSLVDFTLTIPLGSALGSHVLRAKAIDGSATGDILDPCSDFSYGEVHDYTVNITDSSLSTGEFTLEESDFNIYTLPNNQFEIVLKSTYRGNLTFNVYNMLGQQIVFNNIDKRNSDYSYNLDMSYAASGIYIIKMGKGESFKTGKIVVK